jgi:acetyltransferase-like isoleucine patch superfamily enzyme
MSLQKLAVSDHPLARGLRRARRAVLDFTLPAPRVLIRPVLWLYLSLRNVWYFLRRVLVAEPLFKAYCTRYGKGVRTDIFLHWVQGKGEILLGDHVLIDGLCGFTFAARYTARPLLEIGDHTGIGHGCQFTIGKRISIGRHCRIAGDVIVFDSSGHPSDPADRLAGLPTPIEDVQPVTIGDNVWIGRRAIIFPGVTIGEGSVISAGAVVTSDVPANTVVAGNPARRIAALTPADASRAGSEIYS